MLKTIVLCVICVENLPHPPKYCRIMKRAYENIIQSRCNNIHLSGLKFTYINCSIHIYIHSKYCVKIWNIKDLRKTFYYAFVIFLRFR